MLLISIVPPHFVDLTSYAKIEVIVSLSPLNERRKSKIAFSDYLISLTYLLFFS